MESIISLFTDPATYRLMTIVILSIFLGIEVISRVPSVLHTPLMSGANAIHGVVIIGAIIVMGQAHTDDYLALVLGFFGCDTRYAECGRWICGDRPHARNVWEEKEEIKILMGKFQGRNSKGKIPNPKRKI